MKKIAILGAGNMGGAIAASLADTEFSTVCTAATQTTLDSLTFRLPQLSTTLSNARAVQDADIVILCVKPYIWPAVKDEIAMYLKPGASVMSVIAGLDIATLKEQLNAETLRLNILRVIPNIAIRNGKSVTFIAADRNINCEALEEAVEIFNRSGCAFVVEENNMAACTSLASCGIAYFFRFIRALAEGSVELGLKADFATLIAALTAEGAAAMLETGEHPEQLIDQVTTPGGLTIKGLNALESHGFTPAVIAALKASTK